MRDESTPTMTLKRPRNVQFATVEIIELPYTLGDNPSVSGGPPISASWESQKRTSLDLEFFEQYRPPRRNKSALHLTKEARNKLMLLNGHTEMEIQLATVQAGKTRKQRLETIQEIKEKVKSLMSAAAAAAGKVRPLSNNNHRMATPSPVSHQLPPSPIIPRRSPVRACAENPEKLRHLRFPRISDSRILSPRCQIRKRSVPIDLGDELFQGDVLTPHVYSNTPKRLCSPRNPALSPHPENFCASMRFPARVRSPTADSRPLIKPRRLASPPPLMLSQQHSPPPRAS